MMISSEMRDWALHLLAYEATAGATSDQTESVTLRVYEKLRRRLIALAGAAGFQTLAKRALVLARLEVPGLDEVRVTADGSLQGLGEFDLQIGVDRKQADEAGAILIAGLLALLLIFLGEALTLNLVREVWPDAALADRNSGNGRKA